MTVSAITASRHLHSLSADECHADNVTAATLESGIAPAEFVHLGSHASAVLGLQRTSAAAVAPLMAHLPEAA